MADIPILLLAAGGSTRMGRPKQLLPWGNKTLIEHQVETLQQTGNPVNVVLGANANRIIPVIEKYNVPVFQNHHWEDGMGSSIVAGINGVTRQFPQVDGVLIVLVDQPLVPAAHFLNMLQSFHPGEQQIIASVSDSGWKGVPVLFDKQYFNELQQLTGKEGAKKIIQKHRHFVKYVECGNLLTDMDTSEDYHQMLKIFQKSYLT